MIRFGMPTLIELCGAEENLRLCSELGFDFVELNMNLPMFQLEDVGNLRTLSERYAKGYTIHMDENFSPADFNPDISEAWRNTMCRAIEAARILEAPLINMHLSNGVYFTLPEGREYLFERYFDRYSDSMMRFAAICEEKIGGSGLRICIENTDGFPAFQREIIDRLLKSDVFGLTWDIGHSYEAKKDDEAFILGRREFIRHFHIYDADERGCHRELYTGALDIDGALYLAHELNAGCVAETKTVAALKSSAQSLRRREWI